MVSSASSVSAALSDPWRAKPPRPGALPGAAGAAPGAAGAAGAVALGAADADDTVEDWESVGRERLCIIAAGKIVNL